MSRRWRASFLLLPLLVVACRGEELPSTSVNAGERASALIDVPVPYGANEEAGSTFVHDGVTLYFETYGQGEPLLLIHGNGASIGALAAQIDYFRSRYRVIAMDSREAAFYSETLDLVSQLLNAVPEEERATPAGRRALKPTLMMLEEPQIPATQLASIAAPTLVLAGDHDLVRGTHTLEIFESIPDAQLAIFPGATHMVPFDQPELFNSTVERFFESDARQIDRLADVLVSSEELTASMPN